MRLLCVGLNWKTPIQLRERLSFDSSTCADALAEWRGRYDGRELVLLSTCNRTELYAAANEDELDIDDLAEFLADKQKLNLTEFIDHLYFHEDAGTALHLFRVASGLDSLILGEGQILGQVREAYQTATQGGTVGVVLHALFQKALAVAKRVQTETELSKGKLSIASAAVDHVRGVFETFSDKTVLVIGAGKMAELTLTHLVELAPGRLLILNRNAEKAADLAKRFGGQARPWSDLKSALVEADIVISSTGAEEPIAKAKDFPAIMKARKHRLMAIVDIAVPRDFEVEIGQIDNVLLSNIDDLEKIRERTLRSRRKELDGALKIVDAETVEFQRLLAVKQSGPVISQLEREYQRIMEQELEWLLPQLNGLSIEQRDKIRHFAHRLKNKFLHQPKIALREHGPGETQYGLVEAFRKLFGIGHD